MITHVLESCLYATDLDAAERSERTSGEPSRVNGAIVPSHGSTGPGHVAFAIPDAEIPDWRARLEAAGIAIESEVAWPRGGRSLYVRDPAGNCVELASPKLWGFADV